MCASMYKDEENLIFDASLSFSPNAEKKGFMRDRILMLLDASW